MKTQDSELTQIISPVVYSGTIDEGRECILCHRHKRWDDFHRKPNGINGRDSRCKACILKQRKERRKQEKIKKRIQSFDKVQAEVIGELDQDIISEFSFVFAQGISGLIERGELK